MRISAHVLICASVALGACNAVTSDRPMFVGAQTSSVRLKDGVWLEVDRKCKIDPSRPAHEWPDCSFWFLLRGNRLVDGAGKKRSEPQIELLVAATVPPIAQLPLEDGDARKSYTYAVIEPTSRNSSDALKEIRVWPVACGIEQRRAGRAAGQPVMVITRRFPGIDKNCHPTSVNALVAAARATHPKVRLLFRWVREQP